MLVAACVEVAMAVVVAPGVDVCDTVLVATGVPETGVVVPAGTGAVGVSIGCDVQ